MRHKCFVVVWNGETILIRTNEEKRYEKESFYFTIATGLGVSAVVPGGIYTDLERAGVLDGPLFYRFNDVNYRWVALQDWTYQLRFQGNSH